MSKKVLLVVDVQTAMIDDQPYNYENVIANIKQLLQVARASHTEVVYVRHDGGSGDIMEAGGDGWQIYHEIAPMDGEKIFEKNFNSAFKNTGLKEYLDSQNVTTIILVGLQSEYCIDTTCKCAFEYGYKLIMPEETNSTYDNEFMSGEELYRFYNYKIWNGRFARVIPVKEAIQYIESTVY